MPKRLSFTAFETKEESARVFSILTEEDPFRLVIRGHAVVEDMLDRAIDAAFRTGTPQELRKLRLGARVALAEALELITTQVSDAIMALAKVRNRIAHGGEDVVTADELQALRSVVEPFAGDDIDYGRYQDGEQLRIIVAVVWQATGYTLDYAFEKREEVSEALVTWRKENALTAEQVAEVLSYTKEDSAEA